MLQVNGVVLYPIVLDSVPSSTGVHLRRPKEMVAHTHSLAAYSNRGHVMPDRSERGAAARRGHNQRTPHHQTRDQRRAQDALVSYARATHKIKVPYGRSEPSYPAAYTALVLPLSIARWTTFDPSSPPAQPLTASQTPFTATAIVVSIFNLSGVVNVIMFISTRPNVLGFGARRQARAERMREKGPGAISTFGSIAPSRGVGSAGTTSMESGPGVLVMREIVHSSSGSGSGSGSGNGNGTAARLSGSDGPTTTRHTKSTLRFEIEDSASESSDVEDKKGRNSRDRIDVERAELPPVQIPARARVHVPTKNSTF